MLLRKDLSPAQISAFTAAAIALPVAAGIGLLQQSWTAAGISLVLVWVGSYFIFRIALERFIYRKIKLIYKFIHQKKATKREEFYYQNLLPPKTIDEVRQEVEEWGEKQSKEIALLRQNEVFRKEFLQNLAHEFKTPVFAIQGYVETLLNGAIDNRETAIRFLKKTASNTERLSNLMKDLDEISKLERGDISLHKSNFVIQDLIREVFEALNFLKVSKNITTQFKKGCETHTVVYADREKIRQVLANVIENAIKYGKVNGQVTASIYKTDDRILIEIGDDGIGIEEEHLPRIFERFYRTDNARSREKGGTGLGLSICKHIIEAHGQTIHVRSAPEVGTTVGFTLSSRKQ
mgnify:CR=1 FL=1